MSRRSKRVQKRKLIVSLLMLLLVVIGISFAASRLESVLYPQREAVETVVENNGEVYVNGKFYIPKQNLVTTLLMGIDRDTGLEVSSFYQNDGQADFLMLLVEDSATGETFAIHINRDTITNIPVLAVNGRKAGRTKAQITLAFNYGHGREDSCKNMMDAVSYLLNDIAVDHYIALSMDGVAALNDMVGGVEVTIEDDFTGIDDTLIQGETVTLMGEHALRYVRSRSGLEDSSNLNRMERQRQYVRRWAEKFKTVPAEQIIETVLGLSDSLLSDYSVQNLAGFADYPLGEIYTLEGEAVVANGFMEYHVDEAKLQELVLSLFYTELS